MANTIIRSRNFFEPSRFFCEGASITYLNPYVDSIGSRFANVGKREIDRIISVVVRLYELGYDGSVESRGYIPKRKQ